MHSGGACESPLAYLVDLWVQLRRDAARSQPELHRRDRALMPGGSNSLEPRCLLKLWIDQLRASGLRFPGTSVSRVFRLQLLGLALAGFVVGMAVVAVLFDYDGGRPVNVVHVLVVLVGAQLFLVLLLGLVAVPRTGSRWVPGMAVLQDVLACLSPGQLTRWLARRLPDEVRGAVAAAINPGAPPDPWPARVLKWAAMVSAQTFGVGFNLGALATALYLVVFSDLAFAWSTTLIPDIERAHRVTSLLSFPWRGWWPEAVPSQALIQSTLYYRQSGAPAGIAPSAWGGWWSFLVACIAVYGLMPRLLLLGVGWPRLRATLNRAMTETSGAAQVQDRLRTEVVSTQALQAEPGSSPPAIARSSLAEGIPPGKCWAVNWGATRIDPDHLGRELANHPGCELLGLESAGSPKDLNADTRILESLRTRHDLSAVLLIVKAWEPPMLEFLDFVGELRRCLGRGQAVVVLLLGLDRHGRIGPPQKAATDPWRRKLETLGDPDLRIARWSTEAI